MAKPNLVGVGVRVGVAWVLVGLAPLSAFDFFIIIKTLSPQFFASSSGIDPIYPCAQLHVLCG